MSYVQVRFLEKLLCLTGLLASNGVYVTGVAISSTRHFIKALRKCAMQRRSNIYLTDVARILPLVKSSVTFCICAVCIQSEPK